MFLTPLGVLGFLRIYKQNTEYFLQIFTIIPLIIFALFSLIHEIKFNWIGPGLLGIIPWLAIVIDKEKPTLLKHWLTTASLLLLIYSGMILCISFGQPASINKQIFNKYISWQNLIKQINIIATKIEASNKTTPIIIPMDYNLGSELIFYQAKFARNTKINKIYRVIGNHIFDHESLMFKYWSQGEQVRGRTMLLIATTPEQLTTSEITVRVTSLSAIKEIWAHSQGSYHKLKKYYYQVVRMQA
jgi:dolichol-phosphate mannosyltransferase